MNRVKNHPAESVAGLGLAPAWYLFFVNADLSHPVAAILAAALAAAPAVVTWIVNWKNASSQ